MSQAAALARIFGECRESQIPRPLERKEQVRPCPVACCVVFDYVTNYSIPISWLSMPILHNNSPFSHMLMRLYLFCLMIAIGNFRETYAVLGGDCKFYTSGTAALAWQGLSYKIKKTNHPKMIGLTFSLHKSGKL